MINTDNCQEYFDEVMGFAKKNKLTSLKENLEYLGTYACHEGDNTKTRCVLYKDFAPNSFYFVMQIKDQETGEYKYYFNGGLIFYQPHETGVGSPQLSVRLNASNKAEWTVNT